MKLYRTFFKVRGAGGLPFPIDMLRYDQCFPVSSADASAIENAHTHLDPIEVGLEHWGLTQTWAPTSARWLSFLWHVDPHSVEVHRHG